MNIPAHSPEAPDGKNDVDVFEVEPSFTVGKSPRENGNDTSEKIPGAARGLGEGTPKVCSFLCVYVIEIVIYIGFPVKPLLAIFVLKFIHDIYRVKDLMTSSVMTYLVRHQPEFAKW